MSQEQWTAVDDYLVNLLVPNDPVLSAVLEASADAGLPAQHIAPNQGQFLMLLAMSIGAKSVLEIGTLGGYSTIWLARGLPDDGRVMTLEINPLHAEIARENLRRAGVADKVEVRAGEALHSLAQLSDEGYAPFDMFFIDADKRNNTAYFEWALQLSRVGSLIVIDNVVRNGMVVDADSSDINVQGVRRLNERIAAEPRVKATALQTVGSKGYDGFALVLVVR